MICKLTERLHTLRRITDCLAVEFNRICLSLSSIYKSARHISISSFYSAIRTLRFSSPLPFTHPHSPEKVKAPNSLLFWLIAVNIISFTIQLISFPFLLRSCRVARCTLLCACEPFIFMSIQTACCVCVCVCLYRSVTVIHPH